jgi:hypothetical protein
MPLIMKGIKRSQLFLCLFSQKKLFLCLILSEVSGSFGTWGLGVGDVFESTCQNNTIKSMMEF